MHIIEKRINEDAEFYGFMFRTRKRCFDENVIRGVLSIPDLYCFPADMKVAVDIGAHIGAFSLLAARAGAEIYAFEPEKGNYDVLCHNVEVNGYKDKIHCVELGVGNPGEAKLYLHPGNLAAPSVYFINEFITRQLDPSISQMITLISIHDVFEKYNIGYCDVLKLDCEGAEKDIIADLDDDLASRIGQVSVEFHMDSQDMRSRLRKWFPIEKHLYREHWNFFKDGGSA